MQSDEEHILREALLAAGTDPEAPVDSSRKRRRSWYSLLGTAVAYVWPDSVFLQLRAFSCVILILIMRVLNLAVPILYKKVVDTLASTSEGTHPRPGDEKEHYQFWQVNPHHACLPLQQTLVSESFVAGRHRISSNSWGSCLARAGCACAVGRKSQSPYTLGCVRSPGNRCCINAQWSRTHRNILHLSRVQENAARHAQSFAGLTELNPTRSVLSLEPIVRRSFTPLCSST